MKASGTALGTGVALLSPVDEITVAGGLASKIPGVGNALTKAGQAIKQFGDDIIKGVKSLFKGGDEAFDSAKELNSLKKSQKSLQENVIEHEEKIKSFLEDPIGNTSSEKMEQFTKDNPSKEVLVERIMGRVDALKGQLNKNKGELEKVNKRIKEIEGN